MANDFYLRYYVGHKGKFGHEFLEFEFRPDGKLRYANNSNYKNDTMIRKEAYVHSAVMDELKRIIEDSEVRENSRILFLKGQCHEMNNLIEGLKNQISTFCIGADGF